MKTYQQYTGKEIGKMQYLILQIRIAFLCYGQNEHSAYKYKHKSPPRIRNGRSLGRHARKIQGPQGNYKNAEFLPALSVISMTFFDVRIIKQDKSNSTYAVGEGTLTNVRLRHISGNLTHLLKEKSDTERR